jgi:F420-dependent oxidoreductase-like protein
VRFAIKTAPQETSWPELLAMWRAADEIEVFESAWLFDHFYAMSRETPGPCLEAWTTLAALAQATRRLRLGVMVSGLIYRHPAILANMAAAVDIISDGRLEIGLGTGWHEGESTAYGIDVGSPRERSDRLEEACQILIALLCAPATTFDGRYYRLVEARNDPKGPQRPHPPICVGGNGEVRTLRTAARYAQHWNYGGRSVTEFARKREVLARHCAEAGRDPARIMLSVHIPFDAQVGVAATVDAAEQFCDAGADLAIVRLRAPYRPDVLEPIADALSGLSCRVSGIASGQRAAIDDLDLQ